MAGQKGNLGIQRERSPVQAMVRPIRDFLQLEAAGGLLLLAATAVALIWANSPGGDLYLKLFKKTYISIGIGDAKIAMSFLHWINDALMAVFFLLVGLEIKRELLTGELSSARKAALPVAAALGGMVLPAVFYILLNPSGDAQAGWGIPMATDIAFALGILTLVGRGVPIALKVFLVAFAIVDDLGAVLVIALFYTEQLSFVALGIGLGVLAFLFLLNKMGVRSLVPYLLVGVVAWVAFLESGVHATIAGVLLAFTIPHRPTFKVGEIGQAGLNLVKQHSESLEAGDEGGRHGVLTHLHQLARGGQSTLVYLENTLHPFVMYVIMPIFALGNAGVRFEGMGASALADPIALGIVLGLVVGKQVGIVGFSWIAVKAGWADLPKGVGWSMLYGAATLGGVGFTMSLFLAGLAFEGSESWLDISKMGILLASAISGLWGWAWLRRGQRSVTE
ncbi:Na+/H+ antiporter NhaA [bacterium]|nr:Na+/H+ antiporter NhaA [bacterium]